MDYYIWAEACRFIKKCQDVGIPPCPISVNVSRVHLGDNECIRVLADLIKECNIDRKLLELEITETPFDVIKLDKKFMENMMVSDKGRLILEQVVSMANKLDLGLLAEGVETKEQVELLQSIGCDQVQGYYYAKPMPEEEFFELLRGQKA